MMARASSLSLRIILPVLLLLFYHRALFVDAICPPTPTSGSVLRTGANSCGRRNERRRGPSGSSVSNTYHTEIRVENAYTTDGDSNARAPVARATAIAALSVPRGGSTETEISSGGNALVVTLLDFAGKISPSLEKMLRAIFRVLEKLLGMRLLPVEGKRVKKKRGKRQKQKQRVDGDEGEDEYISESKVKKTKRTTAIGGESASSTETGTKAKKKSGTSAASAKHLNTKLKSTSPNYRIQQELKQFLKSPPPNLKVAVGKNIRVWIITMTGPETSIYAGEKYRLRVSFPTDYPTQPPSVYFLQPTPRHEHVYTNGDICLSLLGKDWRPTMTAQSLAVSIMSILSGATRKSLPMDNARHATNKPGGKQDDWIYHDDNC